MELYRLPSRLILPEVLDEDLYSLYLEARPAVMEFLATSAQECGRSPDAGRGFAVDCMTIQEFPTFLALFDEHAKMMHVTTADDRAPALVDRARSLFGSLEGARPGQQATLYLTDTGAWIERRDNLYDPMEIFALCCFPEMDLPGAPSPLPGDVADLLTRSAGSLDHGETALLYDAGYERGTWYPFLTASQRLMGEVMLEAAPCLMQAWSGTPAIGLTRQANRLIIHNLDHAEAYAEPGRRPGKLRCVLPLSA